jgi:hypothetical protein
LPAKKKGKRDDDRNNNTDDSREPGKAKLNIFDDKDQSALK